MTSKMTGRTRVMGYLPPAMRGWYVANAETTRTVFITGSQAIALGANACN